MNSPSRHVSAVYLEAPMSCGWQVVASSERLITSSFRIWPPAATQEMTALRDGLSALALCWTTKRRAAR